MEPLKEALNENFVKSLISDLSSVAKYPESEIQKHFSHSSQWPSLKLKERVSALATLIYNVSEHDFPQAAKVVNQIAPHYSGLQGFVFPAVVENYGLDHFELSMEVLHHITRYSTGEFAIRPFLLQYPKTWSYINQWKKDDNEHVRRLASEGCRPLLPWGLKLHPLVENPSPIFPVLDTLFYDDSEYVRKSVANNLNDISKHHPDRVKAFVKNHSPQHTRQERIIAHGLRTLLKKGDAEAYPIIGFSPDIQVTTQLEIVKNKVQHGDEQIVKCKVQNITTSTISVFVNLIIHYPRKNGTPLRKVFFWKKTTLGKKASINLNKKIAFKDLSTRKHYPGEHKVALQINGKLFAETSFTLTED